MGEGEHRWWRENYQPPAGDTAFEGRLKVWDQIIVTRWTFLMLRHWHSLVDGPDRLRLSRPAGDSVEVRARLVRFIERAERFADPHQQFSI